jgi:hypothetical protein
MSHQQLNEAWGCENAKDFLLWGHASSSSRKLQISTLLQLLQLLREMRPYLCRTGPLTDPLTIHWITGATVENTVPTCPSHTAHGLTWTQTQHLRWETGKSHTHTHKLDISQHNCTYMWLYSLSVTCFKANVSSSVQK